MILDDRKKWAQSASQMIVANIDVTPSTLIRGNANRTALTFFPPVTNRVTVTFGREAALDVGLTLYPGMAPVTFTFDQHGDAVRGEWRAITVAAAQDVTVLETTMIH